MDYIDGEVGQWFQTLWLSLVRYDCHSSDMIATSHNQTSSFLHKIIFNPVFVTKLICL